MELPDALAPLRDRAAKGARSLLHSTYDVVDRLVPSAGPLVPPRRLNPNVGFTPRRSAYQREFIESGEAVASMLVAYGGLGATTTVLDIGSGIGRIARALTSRLGSGGRYHGFDPDRRAIDWCRHAYSGHANFTFTYAPIDYVNVPASPDQVLPEQYGFPYDDNSFDLAFSISVYTHLGPEAVSRYLAETRRVLHPGGVSVNTFFVLDDFALNALDARIADRSYVESAPGVYMKEPHQPNSGIAFTIDTIHSLHRENGLSIVEPVRFGTWSGRQVDAFIYQDVVVSRPSVEAGSTAGN